MWRKRALSPDALAGVVADGATVDWAAAEEAAAATDVAVVRELRRLGMLRRAGATLSATSRARHLLTAVSTAVVVVAALRVVVALGGLVTALARSAVPPGATPFAVNLAVFGVGGLLMVAGSTGDVRLRALGGFYVIIASAFTDPFFEVLAGPLALAVGALGVVRTEAYFAAAIWVFAWVFPRETRVPALRHWGGAALGLTMALSSALMAANVWQALAAVRVVSPPGPGLGAVLRLVDRQQPTSLFWPGLLAAALVAAVFLAAKLRHEPRESRRQVRAFLAALGLGLSPAAVALLASPFVAALGRPDVRGPVGLAVYAGLASMVPMTAYAVGVGRLMNVQFALRATLQYALAHSAIWALVLLPLLYLAADVFLHRGLTFLQYVDARRPGALLALSGAGLVALTCREQLVRAVDRWFLREPLDAPLILAQFEHRLRACEGLRDITAALADALTRALHGAPVQVLVQAPDGATLVALEGDVPPLSRVSSALHDLLAATRAELAVDRRLGLFALLPPGDQAWVVAADAHVLAPLVGAAGALVGVAVVGRPANGLPYSDAHLRLASVLSGQAARQIENRALRPSRADTNATTAVDWRDEPATRCASCGRVSGPAASRCPCGTVTVAADLPQYLNGKFRVQRVVGRGGTGVVYLAVDLALDRPVALKVLPRLRGGGAERVGREARAMAAVRHPHLATIYGVETWRDTPLLVVEYLEAGTLLDWLARGPMAVSQALELGIVLADALDRVHGAGVLHRDIKPSNIGFTADGVAKLLDFGLAAMLDRAAPGSDEAAAAPDPAIGAGVDVARCASDVSATHPLQGTASYLPPEAFTGAPTHPSFDLWGLHVVLYECVVGRHPFGGQPVTAGAGGLDTGTIDRRDRRPACPAPVAAYLQTALAFDPAARPASAAEVRTRLRSLRSAIGQGPAQVSGGAAASSSPAPA